MSSLPSYDTLVWLRCSGRIKNDTIGVCTNQAVRYHLQRDTVVPTCPPTSTPILSVRFPMIDCLQTIESSKTTPGKTKRRDGYSLHTKQCCQAILQIDTQPYYDAGARTGTGICHFGPLLTDAWPRRCLSVSCPPPETPADYEWAPA